eukprot:m.214901 g.214901  ORF g.214901 m.214901 type:complete len:73 (+) comp54068_c0_seq5:705-923(+)
MPSAGRAPATPRVVSCVRWWLSLTADPDKVGPSLISWPQPLWPQPHRWLAHTSLRCPFELPSGSSAALPAPP